MKAYFSIPVLKKDRDKYYNKASKRLRELFPDIDTFYWMKDTPYYEAYIPLSEIFIFTTIDNSFNFSINELPIGVLRELDRAREQNKKIYLAYTNAEGQINFYQVSIQNNLCKGISGSTGQIVTDYRRALGHKDESTDFDPRLLLN